MKQKGIAVFGTVSATLGCLLFLAMLYLSTQPELLNQINDVLGWGS